MTSNEVAYRILIPFLLENTEYLISIITKKPTQLQIDKKSLIQISGDISSNDVQML